VPSARAPALPCAYNDCGTTPPQPENTIITNSASEFSQIGGTGFNTRRKDKVGFEAVLKCGHEVQDSQARMHQECKLNLLTLDSSKRSQETDQPTVKRTELLVPENLGIDEKALRIARVSALGLAYSVPGAWHTIKHDLEPANWKETGKKILGAAAVGAGMRIALPESGAFKAIAGAVLTLSFIKDASRPILTAWQDVSRTDGEPAIKQSARNLGEALGKFAVDGYLSNEVAHFAGLITPVYADRYMPETWIALENWKDAHLKFQSPEQPGNFRYGIGIRLAEREAIKDGVLHTEIGTGHCFAYVKDADGKVTDVLSTGPANRFNFKDESVLLKFLAGMIPAKNNFQLNGGPMTTWEFPISENAYEEARTLIQQEKLHPGHNYTPFHCCPALPVEIGQMIGLPIPSGVSLVQTPLGKVPFINPYGLERQLNRIIFPRVYPTSTFEGLALTNVYGVQPGPPAAAWSSLSALKPFFSRLNSLAPGLKSPNFTPSQATL
jgi:hypothetical protein